MKVIVLVVMLNNFRLECTGWAGAEAETNQCQLPRGIFDVYERDLGMSNRMHDSVT